MMGYGQGYGSGGYGGMMSGGGWLIGLMMLFGTLVIVGVVLLIIWAVRASGGHGMSHQASMPPLSLGSTSAAAAHDEAVAIAKRRMASGEITTEQYAEILRHLGG